MKMRNLGIGLIVLMVTSAARADEPRDYYKSQLQLTFAWKITRGSPNVTVAVLSTGLAFQNPEIAGNLAYNPDEIGSDGVDNDRNGYVDDVLGANVYLKNGDIHEGNYDQGTFGASLIASRTFGVAPEVRVLPVKVLNDDGSGTFEGVAAGIHYALSRKADVIYLPIGWHGSGGSQVICDMIRKAGQSGSLVVAPATASGAQVTDSDYPAGCNDPDMLVVTASNENSQLAPFAAWSPIRVHLAAPGMKIASFNKEGRIETRSGVSSISTALTAGVAALVKSKYPNYSATDLRNAVLRGVDSIPELEGKVSSNGRLNAYKALTASGS